MASDAGKKAGKKAVRKATEESARKAAAKATKKATEKAAQKPAKKVARKGSPGDLLARGGGAAPAAGVTFQGWVGGLFAATGLTQASVDKRLLLKAESVAEFRLETESPIDDLLIYTTAPGRLFVQAKTNLSMAQSDSDDMMKTLDQFVRQWRLCSEGKNTKGWDYPFNRDRDRFVIAVSPETPNTVAVHLAKALVRRREGGVADTTPKAQKDALDAFTAMLKAAWKRIYETAATKRQIEDILDLVVVAKFDFDGPDFGFGEQLLKGELVRKSISRSAFATLAHECEERMRRRTSFTIQEIRRVLERDGIKLVAPEDYRDEIAALKKRSEQLQGALSVSTKLDLGKGASIPILRPVLGVAAAAADKGSFLIVGEPGAGKTGVLVSVADQLRSLGREVLLLKVSPSGLTGLKSDLGLSHPLGDILENWPGTDAAFLLIDGLDEARGGAALSEYRDLIATTLALPGNRWIVVASVRSFDLRSGVEFKSLFKGLPPNPDYAAPGQDLANVKQIEVRPWSDAEFKELLKKAPKLHRAIDIGGQRLREIALVPFNTQLLAEVVALGVSDQELGSIRNQTDLLERYWEHRVVPIGAEGKACLASTIEAMVEARGLELESAPLESKYGNMLDRLQHQGVLVPRRNGRQIAFRHNILFDYAASRLYLDPFGPEHLHELLLRDRGLGLILGPALGYALQELWNDQPDRARFWDLVILLVSDKNVDPIARSLAARRASEFPKLAVDIRPLTEKLAETQGSSDLLQSLVGALTILLEDSPQLVETAPWAFLAERLSTNGSFAGSLTYLSDKLLKRQLEPEAFDGLGRTARNLLEYAFAAKSNPKFVAFCIPLVADTYSTAPEASRGLLDKVFHKEELEKFGYIEVPALARQIDTIARNDTGFAVSIYARTFAHRVDSQKQKAFSDTQIMPMRSSESDMYSMASYSLAAHFPKFFKDDRKAATEALVGVIEGHIATHHPIPKTVSQKTLHVGQAMVHFIEDASRYWGWEINTTHPDSTQMILQQHIANLQSASEEEAGTIVSVLFEKNRLAVLWARLLMVGAERPGVYAGLLWELATNEQILLCSDTTKDAIDAIAAFYPLRTIEERQTFEEKVFAYGAEDPVYQSIRQERLEVLFQTIGEQNLVTEQARALSIPKPDTTPAVNARPFSIEGGAVPFGIREQLLGQGVDLEASTHSEFFALIEQINAKLGLSQIPRPRITDLPAAVSELRKLVGAITEAEEHRANKRIIQSAQRLISNGNLAVLESAQRDKAAIAEKDLSTVREIALSLSQSSDSDSGASLRADAVTQLFFLCQCKPGANADVVRLAELASDSEPNVRAAVARNLATLFEFFPARMWKLAETFTKNERDPLVMAQLVASFLGGLRNRDPKRIESMLLRIQDRFPYVVSPTNRDPRESLWECSAKLMAGLYVWNDRKKSRERLFDWAANPLIYEDQIRNALYAVRQAVCQGYDADTPALKPARQRIQSLLNAVVDHSAAALEQHYALDAKSQKEKYDEGLRYAKCLEYACASLFFCSGAFRENNLDHASPIQTEAGKQRFVNDVQQMIRRLGDIAITPTVYQLVQLLDFLLPGEPPVCFDLFTHALTMSGRRHGFQGESLGVDVLVRIVSRCLADYDYIFRDTARRDSLIACLDIFIEAGWPAALRLLYSLPDSLR